MVLSNRETMGRAIIYNLGTAEKMTKEELPLEAVKNARYLHLAMLDDVAVEAAKAARQAGVKVFLDADSYSDELGEFIPMVDVFVASEFVYDAMFEGRDYEASCRRVMERGPEINYIGFHDRGMLLAGGCGDTNDGPQIDKTRHLHEAYEFGRKIFAS